MLKQTENLFIVTVFISSIFLFTNCQSDDGKTVKNGSEPDSTKMVMQDSDSKALAIADSVMEAMGGEKAWKETNILRWTFFGRRSHTWDKEHNRDHISVPGKNLQMTVNLETKDGTVFKNGESMTKPDSLQKYLKKAYSMWVNDSYWLVMPFKLKDHGVKLEYLGIQTTQSGKPAYKLKLTYGDVGLTPENKFHVYVDTTDNLVKQWAYFPKASDDTASFVLPWTHYKQYGDILLSGNRGPKTLSDIEVLEEWPFEE